MASWNEVSTSITVLPCDLRIASEYRTRAAKYACERARAPDQARGSRPDAACGGARQRRRSLDPAADRGPAGRRAALRRPPGGARRNRPERAHAAPAAPGGGGARARPALPGAPAALRVRADLDRPRAGRSAAAAGRLGRAAPRGPRSAPPRGLRHAG